MVQVHSSTHSYEYTPFPWFPWFPIPPVLPYIPRHPLRRTPLFSPLNTQTYTCSYPWPIVTLAWFLRYPNPYATHVLSTDTIHQSLSECGRLLKVVRLHLKRGKLPVWSKRFLSHISESWIVETTVVDLGSGVMETRMRNLDHRRVLYVEERGSWRQQLGVGNTYFPTVPCLSPVFPVDVFAVHAMNKGSLGLRLLSYYVCCVALLCVWIQGRLTFLERRCRIRRY